MKEAKGAKNVLLFASLSLFWLSLVPIHRQNTQIQFDDLFPAGWMRIKDVDEGENAKKDDNKFLLRMRFCVFHSLSLSLLSLFPPPPPLCGLLVSFIYTKTVRDTFKSLSERVVL
jgi:hypothetical protein